MNTNYYQIGQTVKCGHCEPSDYEAVEPCECKCHIQQNPPSNLGGEVTRTLTEQIIELMGEERHITKGNTFEVYEDNRAIGFNQARTEMINKIPEILSLIRGIIDETLVIEVNPSNDDQRDWYRGLGREEAQRKMRDNLLEKLK